jgi:glyoxylase-like metal-dependent hydrolase (beta-lactamase superfamily II)
VNDGCIEVGAWRITPLSDGTMRLDGGGMWGVVPRSLWARMTPPAADNTIPLALRPFLLQREGYTVVVEPGVGGHLPEKWARNYALDRTTTLARSLAALGLAPEDVTHVVASHCHFDHIGGWITRDERGALAPLFPRARHLAPAIEGAVA